MKKLIISLLMACGLFSTVAQESLFNAKELSVVTGGSMLLDGKNQLNLFGGINYSITKNLLVEANIPFYQSLGTSIDGLSGGLALRLPISKNVAPTVRVGSFYNWDTERFSYYAGAGLEVKLNKKWSVIPGVDYIAQNFDFDGKGTWSPNVAIKLTF